MILVLLAGWTALAHAGCSGDADCSYNGRCVDATACTCDPQFQGARCDVFAFAPLDPALGVGLQTISTSPPPALLPPTLLPPTDNGTCQSNLCHPCTPPSNGSVGPGTCCNKTWHCFYDQVFHYNLCLPPYHWICQPPPPRTAPSREPPTRISSWGGSVLLADDGTYHMWAAEMTESTGIKAWITNSHIVHAVAGDPRRPFQYTRKEVVWPVFAHEPTVSRAPSGEYVMMFTTNDGEAPGSQCNPPCDCGHNGTSCLSCPNDQQCRYSAPLQTAMSWSNSTDGPWSTPVAVPQPSKSDTNLACVIRSNSSLVCMGRPGLGMLFAPDWRDISSYAWHVPTGTSIVGEDPMLWFSHNESVLHVVTHGGGWGQPFGFLYWSDDGGRTWTGTGQKVYENVVERVDGERKILSRRERPHVVLDGQGALLGLTNGVTEAWPCTLQAEPDRAPCTHPTPPGVNPSCGPGSNGTSIWCPDDYSYTLFQRFQGPR